MLAISATSSPLMYTYNILSAFVRDAAIRVAQGLIDEYGAEAIFKTFETTETQRAEETRARVNEFRSRLLSQYRAHPAECGSARRR